jgi:hypothetical protein
MAEVVWTGVLAEVPPPQPVITRQEMIAKNAKVDFWNDVSFALFCIGPLNFPHANSLSYQNEHHLQFFTIALNNLLRNNIPYEQIQVLHLVVDNDVFTSIECLRPFVQHPSVHVPTHYLRPRQRRLRGTLANHVLAL